MTKIEIEVVHADLNAIDVVAGLMGGLPTGSPAIALLRRVRDAVQAADLRPPGWYLLNMDDNGLSIALYHPGDGRLYHYAKGREGTDLWGDIDEVNGTLTPILPTLTEADVKRIARKRWEQTRSPGALAFQQEVVRDVVERLGIPVVES